jgi:hypothetical protein
MKLAAIVLTGLLSALPAVAATNYEELLDEARTLHEQFDTDMQDALEALADGDLVTAKDKLQSARTRLVASDNLIAQAKADLILPRGVANTSNALTDGALADLDRAILLVDDQLKTKAEKVIKALGTNFRAARAQTYLQRSNRSLNRLMLIDNIPSLYPAGRKVCWNILGIPSSARNLPASECPLAADYVNPFGASLGITPIQSNPFVAPNDNPCTGRVCFLMGRDMGGGRIEIKDKDTGDVLVKRIVFNYGSPFHADGIPRTVVSPNTGQAQTPATLNGVSQFAGTYVGSYTGTFTLSETCGGDGTPQPVGGASEGTVSSAGKITVTAPGTGSGSVSPLGTYAAGGVNLGGATATFRGAIINNRFNDPGSAIASGGWTAKGPCGTGSGTWAATRAAM